MKQASYQRIEKFESMHTSSRANEPNKILQWGTIFFLMCQCLVFGIFLSFQRNEARSSELPISTLPQSQCRPKQIHMAAGLSGPSTSMTISFSMDFNCGDSVNAAVLYGEGKEGAKLDRVAFPSVISPKQYNASDETYGSYVSDYFHHISLSDLTPSTNYRYECVTLLPSLYANEVSSSAKALRRRRLLSTDTSSAILSTSFTSSFQTSPLAGTFPTSSQPLKFALVGDLGQTTHSGHTVSHMANVNGLTAVLHAGDMSYANGNHSRWDSWFESIQPLSRRVPWHVIPGNHEIEINKSTGSIFDAYEHRFQMPSNREAEKSPFKKSKSAKTCCPSAMIGQYDYGNAYHAVTYGPVRVIFLNSYTSSLHGSKQYNWLLEELALVDRSLTPWLIVIMHCPFYNTFARHQNEQQTVQMKESMEPLFVRHSVNLVVAGHVHAYTRTKPVANGKVTNLGAKGAPEYILIGDGGNLEGHNNKFLNAVPEEWVEVRDGHVFGFGLLEISNKTHAKWQWVKNVDEGTTKIHDEGYITNQLFIHDGREE